VARVDSAITTIRQERESSAIKNGRGKPQSPSYQLVAPYRKFHREAEIPYTALSAHLLEGGISCIDALSVVVLVVATRGEQKKHEPILENIHTTSPHSQKSSRRSSRRSN
jgi:hypothetical protein